MCGSKIPEVPLFLVFERDLDTRKQIYRWDIKNSSQQLRGLSFHNPAAAKRPLFIPLRTHTGGVRGVRGGRKTTNSL